MIACDIERVDLIETATGNLKCKKSEKSTYFGRNIFPGFVVIRKVIKVRQNLTFPRKIAFLMAFRLSQLLLGACENVVPYQ